MGPSINLHYCAGFVRVSGHQHTVTDHLRSIITIKGKQQLVLFCPPPHPKHPEDMTSVTSAGMNLLFHSIIFLSQTFRYKRGLVGWVTA